jgi:hypothetical protein
MYVILMALLGEPTIDVPRSWLLGHERSACCLRAKDVHRVLGKPDFVASSSWCSQEWYARWGIGMTWEYPCVMWSIGNVLGAEAKKACLTGSPMVGGILLYLLETKVLSRESLLSVRWSDWGMNLEWSFDRDQRPAP